MDKKDNFQEVFILHRRPFKDNHFILEVFCKEKGRMGILAKNARRAKSPWRSILHPFIPLLVQCTGKGELQTLHSAETCGIHYVFSPKALLCGMYVNEILLYLLHRFDPHPEIFHAYAELLYKLNESTSLEISLRLFEKHLLHALGFALCLDHNPQTQEEVLPESSYLFSLEEGPGLIDDSTLYPAHTIFKGRSLLALHHENLQVEDLREVKRLMRSVIDKLLDYKPLKVRELFV